jgi:hypothetical protein
METRMKMSSIPHGLALAAVLALSSSGAFAAAGELRALSETEMSNVYGRGLSEPALTALGALTTSEQSASALSSQAAADSLAAWGGLSADGLQGIDRQLAQQRLLQSGTTTLQATMEITSTMAALSASLAPIANAVTLPVLPIPFLFTLPALPSLDAIQKKH